MFARRILIWARYAVCADPGVTSGSGIGTTKAVVRAGSTVSGDREGNPAYTRICRPSAQLPGVASDGRHLAMFDLNKPKTWVGVLETSSARVPVLFDAKLPEAPTGQIYLFNLERGAIVQYRWNTVKERLRDVDPEERLQLKLMCEMELKPVRREFLKHHKSVPVVKSRAVAPQKATENPPREWEREPDSFKLEDMTFD